MQTKSYKNSEKKPKSVGEPAVAYRITSMETSSLEGWNPNVPFHGTQEEWWEHFHRIEEGEFMTWDEHQKRFNAWKKMYLANRM